MKEKFLTKGNISLFSIAFAVTLIVAVVCYFCGAERMTTLFSAPIGGILSVLIIGGLYELTSEKAPMGPDAGILGVVIATLLSLIIF